eukprot:655600-Rhodomonas_salina.1
MVDAVLFPQRMEGWKLDRNIDPHTGVEMPDCVGPQCKEFTISFGDGKSPIEDSYGAPPTGHAVFGAAIPGNADESPEKVRERLWTGLVRAVGVFVGGRVGACATWTSLAVASCRELRDGSLRGGW